VTNPNISQSKSLLKEFSGAKCTAPDVARGVSRLLVAEGYSPVTEFTLGNGRRLDVAGLNAKGEILGVEIKVSLADLRSDRKWPEYIAYCDLFYFAVPPEFPQAHVPESAGLIIADSYGGAIIRQSRLETLHASRRCAVMLRFAQCAADRLARLRDPNIG
jgi:hypothetical protein